MRACLTAAATAHQLPPAMLVILLKVEGGTLGPAALRTLVTRERDIFGAVVRAANIRVE